MHPDVRGRPAIVCPRCKGTGRTIGNRSDCSECAGMGHLNWKSK